MTEAGGHVPSAASGPPVPAAVDLIRAKRDNVPLSGHEIDWVIGAYLRGEVAEEQMSALLMAIYFRGLDPAELAQLLPSAFTSADLPKREDAGD